MDFSLSTKPIWSGVPINNNYSQYFQNEFKTEENMNSNNENIEEVENQSAFIEVENQSTFIEVENQNTFIEVENQSTFIEEDLECSKDFLYRNKNTKECINDCNFEELLNYTCLINNLTYENIENITKEVRKILNNTEISPKINIIINGGNSYYQIIASTNMGENNNNNRSIIDFGECETKLKEQHGIDYLLFLKIDTELNSNSPILINYEVYNPKTLQKLELSVCKNLNIQTYSHFVPSKESLEKYIKLNESGHDFFNINDSFYQDLCVPFTSDNGTDILLSDRKTDFYDNISLCQEGCTYSKYDYENKKVQCECKVKIEIEMPTKFDETIFLLKFIDIDNFSNIKVLKCYKLVFSKEGQTDNIGSYVFLLFIFLLIVLCVMYRIFHMKNIIRILRKIINNNFLYDKNNKINISNIANNNIDNKNINISIKKSCNPLKKKVESKKSISIFSKRNSMIKNVNIKEKNENFSDIKKIQNHNSSSTLPNIKRVKRRNAINVSSLSKILVLSKDKENSKKKDNKKDEKIKESNNNRHSHHHHHHHSNSFHFHKHNYNDEELNELEYRKAFKYDKRTIGQYYCCLIKKKHLLFFTFFNNDDYNVFILKLSLLIFSTSLYFTVNAVFFVDNNVHNIYEKQGRINLLLQIPNILYSAVISSIIGLIIKIFALSEKEMLKIKQISNEEEALRQSALLLDKLILKFNLFFVICFIFEAFFWYFISAFCSVYKNTQKVLFENTLSSFGLSMLYPFGLNLIPVILRIPSLQKKTKCNESMYRISKVMAYL